MNRGEAATAVMRAATDLSLCEVALASAGRAALAPEVARSAVEYYSARTTKAAHDLRAALDAYERAIALAQAEPVGGEHA